MPNLGALRFDRAPEQTAQAPQPLRFDDVVLHQLSQLKVACLLAAAFAPVAVGMCALYNFALDEYAAHGEDPRYPVEPNAVASGAQARGYVLLLVLPASIGSLCAQAVIVMRANGRRPTRRAAAMLTAAVLAVSLWTWYGTVSGSTASRGRQAATTGLMLALGAACARWAARATQSRRVGWLVLGMLTGSTVTSLSLFFFGAAWFLHTRDLWRLIVLALSTAVFVEPTFLAIRGACYAAPPARARLPVLACWGYATMVNLFQRWAISVMDTAAGTTAAIAIVGAVNALVWHSIARRDLWLAGGTFLCGGPFAETTARSVSATIRCVAEIADMFACIAMAMLVALFRVGPDKQAPAPAPILLSLAGQLFVCLGTDFAGALAALWLGPQSAVYRSYARGFELRATALRDYRRRAMLLIVTGYVVAAAAIVARALYDPVRGDRALACAWSRPEHGWWHRAPCDEVEGWVGSSD